MTGLAGRVGLVTHTDDALGRGIALELASAGAAVAWASEATANSGAPPVPESIAVRADLLVEAEAERLVDEAAAWRGRLDFAVHVAAQRGRGADAEPPLTSIAVEEFGRELDRALDGTFHACRAVLRRLVRQGAGELVVVVSPIAFSAPPGLGAWSAAQRGAAGLARSIIEEARPFGVRVQLVMADAAGPCAVEPRRVGEVVARLLALPRDVTLGETWIHPFQSRRRAGRARAARS